MRSPASDTRNAIDEELNVVGLQIRTIFDRRQASRIGCGDLRGVMQNLLFHGQFQGIRQLEAVGAEELDAVVAPGIVRGGDDRAGVESMAARQEGDGRRGHNARALDARSGFAQARSKGGRDPRAAFARVAAQNHPGLRGQLAQAVAQRQSRGVHRGWVQRRLARDAANAVGAEEFSCACFGHGLTSCVACSVCWSLCSLPG